MKRLFEPMTLQPGDPVQLTREQAAARGASARARRDWPIRIGMVQKIRRHSPWAYVIWADNRHADQEQICVLEKIECSGHGWRRTFASPLRNARTGSPVGRD